MTEEHSDRVSYSIAEAARFTGLSQSAIRRAIDSGDLTPRYPTPGKPLIPADELRAWVKTASTQRRSA